VLVSDADREAVVERLRAACGEGRLTLEEFSDRVADVYRARTTAELDTLTTDLPVPVEPGVAPTRWIVGVFGSGRRSGPWRPDQPTRAVAVFGACRVDLTGVDLAPETDLVAVAVCGGIEVVVGEGVQVDLGGFAVFGGRDDRTSSSARGGPVVRVRARVVFGGVTVRTHPFR
jgi:hypothetical protein